MESSGLLIINKFNYSQTYTFSRERSIAHHDGALLLI
jgi:hypothetical protein